MTLRTLRPSFISSRYATRLAVALALGCAISTPAHALRHAHSRIVSASNSPLQVLVGIADLTPDEQRSLMATLADPAAWERAGVTPPVPLSTMTLRLEGGGGATRRNLRISSSEAAKGPVVDLLLNLETSEGQRQLQVSVMQSAGGFPGLTSQAQVGSGTRSARGAAAVGVRPGDTLYGIAQSNAVADATIYQMLVALWRANPRAFIQNNMNLVKAGATLVVPDAATVRAIDPAEARRIFVEQAEAYARYRASLAGAAARGSAASGASSAAGQVGATPPASPPEPSAQDRVRLSSGEPGKGDALAQAQVQGDAQTSTAKATEDAQKRVDELERNVKDLNDALASTRGADQGQGDANATAGDGRAAADYGQAAGSGLSVPSGVGGAGAGSSSASGPGTGNQASARPEGAGQSGATPQGSPASPSGAQGGGPAASNRAAAQGGATTPGVSGDASALGGTSGQSGTPGSSASAAGGASAQTGGSGPGISASGAAGSSSGAGSQASGAGSPAAPSGTGSSAFQSGTSPQAGAAAGAGTDANIEPGSRPSDNAGSPSDKQDAISGLPSWLSDNLLIILTAVLALVAFVIAWLLRRAAARREEDQDELDDELYLSEVDQGAIDRRLEGINLDLDEPPGADDRRRPGTVRT